MTKAKNLPPRAANSTDATSSGEIAAPRTRRAAKRASQNRLASKYPTVASTDGQLVFRLADSVSGVWIEKEYATEGAIAPRQHAREVPRPVLTRVRISNIIDDVTILDSLIEVDPMRANYPAVYQSLRQEFLRLCSPQGSSREEEHHHG